MFEEDKLLKDLATTQPKRGWFSRRPHINAYNFPATVRKIAKTLIYSLVFCVGLFILFYVNSSLSEKDSLSWINSIPIIGQIKTFAETSSSPLKGEERGRVNILFLGVGGEGHEGGQLTDTIMVFSINTRGNKVAMLSIPRDLSIPIENMGWRKINNVNAYAEMSAKGSGGKATSQAVANILKEPIDYYVKIDFEGFKKIIDFFGGVEIEVANTFDDYTYPAAGQETNPNYEARFEHLHFDKGVQMMNAETALKYARSRHAYGVEGTDFARAHRQQKVIEALKAKSLSVSTLTNPTLIANIYNTLQSNMSTDLKVWEILKVWNMVKNIDQGNIVTKVLSNQPSGLLVDSTGIDGAYLLMPRTGNFTEIQYYFKHIFEAAPEQVKAKITSEQARIRILNGTWINGLASKMASDLEKYNFEIINVGNCSRQNFETSVIYDLTFGAKKDSLELLKKKTGANVSFTLPDWLKADLARETASGTVSRQPDLILILGQDVEASYNEIN